MLVILYAGNCRRSLAIASLPTTPVCAGRSTFISPQVSGYITAVNVKDFAIVQPGEVLFQIDDRIYTTAGASGPGHPGDEAAAPRNNLQQRKSRGDDRQENEAALQNARAQNLKIQADLKTHPAVNRRRFAVDPRT